MRHLILDDSVRYNKHYANYRFIFDNGYKSDYIKLKYVEPVDDGLLPLNNFRVVRNNHTGYYNIVKGEDKSPKCLLFIGFKSEMYETIKVDDTGCQILSINMVTYKNTTEIKLAVVIHPRRPLKVKYTNTKTGSVRYEYVAYNYIEGTIVRKTITSETREHIRNNIEILNDTNEKYEIARNFTINKQFLENLTEEDIKLAGEYTERYFGRYPR